MATSCAAYPKDIYTKVQKALSIKGPKFMHILTPCPPGWRYSSEKSIELGKLAVKTGVWAMYEREYGKLKLSSQTIAAIRKPLPIEDYIAPQERFKGLDPATLTKLKQGVEHNLRLLEQEAREADKDGMEEGA